jgi:hypothetical protein
MCQENRLSSSRKHCRNWHRISFADRLSRHHRVVPSASLDKSNIIIQLWQPNNDYIGRYYMRFG